MTQQHNITPPSELVKAWLREIKIDAEPTYIQLAAKAAQWGADQELEACLNCMNEWGAIHNSFGGELADDLRALRRRT